MSLQLTAPTGSEVLEIASNTALSIPRILACSRPKTESAKKCDFPDDFGMFFRRERA